MGSPISTIWANLFMEEFEFKAISTASNQPRFWYVYGTFVIQQVQDSQQFSQHNKNIDSYKQFITEVPNSNWSIPFLDTLISPGPDNTLVTFVYNKPSHTEQYLHWDSHNSLSSKYNVFNTFTHRVNTICAKTQILHKEEECIGKALHRCNYPTWALNRLQTNNNYRHSINYAQTTTATTLSATTAGTFTWWSHTKKWLSKSFKNGCGKWEYRLISKEATPSGTFSFLGQW